MKLKQLLQDKLSAKELSVLPSSFDVVGNILIFADFPKELKKKRKIIGETILSNYKNIKTVLKKSKKYSGKYRLPKLSYIAGKKKKETMHKENNISLKLNVEKVYFSPRLATERLRIAKLVKKNESVLVMFSGSGAYPLVIAKNSNPNIIYGIEVNPIAHKYAEQNIFLNKIKNIKLIKGDVKKIIPKLNEKFDRIVMPLPKGAENYLDSAFKASKKKAIIHLYLFSEEDKISSIAESLKNASKKLKKKIKIINIAKCGQFSPRVNRICIDFQVL